MITHMNYIQAQGFRLGTVIGATINFPIPGFNVHFLRFNFGSCILSIFDIFDLGRFKTKLTIPPT